MSELKDKFTQINTWSLDGIDVSTLKGETFKDVFINKEDDNFIMFETEAGKIYQMFHNQDCCEDVVIDDVCGDISDLIGAEILHFEERTSEGEVEYGTETWTFYDIQTKKGCVNLKWHGESNGYYSESVDFIEIK